MLRSSWPTKNKLSCVFVDILNFGLFLAFLFHFVLFWPFVDFNFCVFVEFCWFLLFLKEEEKKNIKLGGQEGSGRN